MTKRSDNDFDSFTQRISSAASDVGALVVHEILEISDRSAIPRVSLNADDIASIILYAKPRIVYLAEHKFELDSEIADALDTLEEETNSESDTGGSSHSGKHFEKLTKKWRCRDGQLGFVFVGFMADGVLHTAVPQPAWRDEFESELENALEEAREALENAQSTLSELDSEEVCEKAVILAEHASFNSGRPSFPKRLFLAGQLFPKLEPKKLQAITNRAEKLDWLKKSGFKP